MSLLNVFNIAGSAMNAQATRLNVVASNLANADSTTGPDGKPYQARQVVFQAFLVQPQAMGVKVEQVITDPRPMRIIHEPSHPHANAEGFVTLLNENLIEEMANMIAFGSGRHLALLHVSVAQFAKWP